MSTLISSAVAGKKAAPKAAARRRPAAPTGPGKAATPISLSSAPTSVAPPSPPPTQQPETQQTPAPSEQASTPAPTQVNDARATPQTTDARAPSPPLSETRTTSKSQSKAPRDATSIRAEASTQASAPPAEETQAADEDQEPAPAQPAPSKKRPRATAPVKESSRPAKRVKRSSARSNATVQSTAQEEDLPAAPAKSSRAVQRDGRRRSASSATPAEPAGATKKRAPAKRKSTQKSAATIVDSDAEEEPEEVVAEPQKTLKPASKPRTKRGPRKKAPTVEPVREQPGETAAPEGEALEQEEEPQEEDQVEEDEGSDPELHEIDPNTVTMFELGKDRKRGKTSEREKKMAEIDWDEVARKRREAIEKTIAESQQPAQPTADVVETTERPDGTADPSSDNAVAPDNDAPTEDTTAAAGGVQFRIVNGQIVEDETSLTIDRQAQAEAEAQTGAPMEEDNDLTSRINSSTYLNDRRRDVADRLPLQKKDAWPEAETERFYEALRMWGTDFGIISTMFAPKTRRQLKMKFNREERLDPARVNAALLGKDTVPMNLEHFARESGRDISEYTKYDGYEHAQQVIGASMEDRREAMEAALEEEAAVERNRKAAREMNRKERGRKKDGPGRGRKKKGVVEGGFGGGDPVGEGGGEAQGAAADEGGENGGGGGEGDE